MVKISELFHQNITSTSSAVKRLSGPEPRHRLGRKGRKQVWLTPDSNIASAAFREGNDNNGQKKAWSFRFKPHPQNDVRASGETHGFSWGRLEPYLPNHGWFEPRPKLDGMVGMTLHCFVLSLLVLLRISARVIVTVGHFLCHMCVQLAIDRGRVTVVPVANEEMQASSIYHVGGVHVILAKPDHNHQQQQLPPPQPHHPRSRRSRKTNANIRMNDRASPTISIGTARLNPRYHANVDRPDPGCVPSQLNPCCRDNVNSRGCSSRESSTPDPEESTSRESQATRTPRVPRPATPSPDNISSTWDVSGLGQHDVISSSINSILPEDVGMPSVSQI